MSIFPILSCPCRDIQDSIFQQDCEHCYIFVLFDDIYLYYLMNLRVSEIIHQLVKFGKSTLCANKEQLNAFPESITTEKSLCA